MNTKHTQGEWILNSDNTITSGETHIARTSLGKSGIPYIQIREEEQANAKLIAAAPDLLEALQELPDINADTSEWIDWIIKKDKAIKKATE